AAAPPPPHPAPAHQPLPRAPSHRRALPLQLMPDLAGAVHPVVGGVDAADVGQQRLVADLPRPGRPGPGRVLPARGDLAAVRSQHAADRLNPTKAGLILVDEPHERVCGRSSSAAKKADAAFKISFARRSSAFSRLSRFSSADSSLVTPGRWPPSTCA